MGLAGTLGRNRNAQCLMLNVQLNIENYALNISWKHKIRFTRNALSESFATNCHE